MTAVRAGRVGLALLLALAVGAGGCGKYGRPVRSAPAEARDLAAAERDTARGFEAESPEEQPAEENGEKKREPEQQEKGEGQ